VSVDRVRVLVGKELREFRANPSVIIPVLIVVALSTLLPILIVVVIPRATGQSLSTDRGLQQVVARAAAWMPSLAALPPEAAAEAFFFQQFLFMFLIAPIIGAVSLAAYAVVGEKQGRTLEPLLTTPVSTAELLVAKALASFLPALVIEAGGLGLYVATVAAIGSPGVLAVLLTGRTLLLVGVMGPLAALAALQATIAVSSRANDPRSAQQIAVLLVMPLMVMFVGQIAGAFVVTTGMLALVTGGIAAAWVLLVLLSVALFDRETILTRWK
jgi:ABC-2 type transport system permease protein